MITKSKSHNDVTQVIQYLEIDTAYNEANKLPSMCCFCGHIDKREYHPEDKGKIYQGVCDSCYPDMDKYIMKAFEIDPDNWYLSARYLKYKQTRLQVIAHYSNYTMSCRMCGYSESDADYTGLDVFQIGKKQNRQVYTSVISQLRRGNRLCRDRLYTSLKRHNFPTGYQILCYNCHGKLSITR